MGATTKAVLIAVAVLAIFCILGAVDYSEALTQEAIEKEARPHRAALAIPINYDAIVCQRAEYDEPAKCRYYARRDK